MRDRDQRGGKDWGKGRDQSRDRPGSGGGKPFKPKYKDKFKPRFGERDRPREDSRPSESEFKRQDRGFKRPDGGFKRQDGGFKREDGGFKRPEGGFKRPDGGFKRQDGGFKRQDGGFKRRKKQFRDPANKPPLDRTILYGWHPVVTALANPKRRLRRLVLTENAARRLTEDGITPKQAPELVRPEVIDRMLTEDAVHQGLYAEFDPLPEPELEDIEPGLILVLDQITDPHNFGAIVRSAAAFDVKAIVTTSRHSPDATGVLAKSASGGLEHVPLVLVQNLARAMNDLKSSGWQLVGLAEEGEADISEAKLRKPLALVLGAEGKGLRQLTRETCDLVARLDLPGAIKSLNVSNAAALALYAASQTLKKGAG